MAKVNIFMIVMVLLSINVVLYTAGIRVVEDSSVIDQFVDTDQYEINSSVKVTDDFSDTVSGNFRVSGANSFLQFIDTLGAVQKFIVFIINIVFTPLGLFMELPGAVALMFGVPMMIAGVLAIIFFIRNGD